MSQKATVQRGFRLTMSGSVRPEQIVDDGVPDGAVVAEERPACVALVPVVATAHRSRVPERQLSRADFVTQLIATAEHAPQTRTLRRATPAVAQAAYSAPRHPVQGAGIRTRQIV
jgi:hypothetical protein